MSTANISATTSAIYGKTAGGKGNGGFAFAPVEIGETECREGRDLVDVGGIGVDCLRLGKGAPLLVLHGLNGSRGMRPLIDCLAEEFEVIAPSLPCFGGSPRSLDVTTVTDLAELIAELREQLAPGSAVLGLSFGGWVAMQMAATVARDIRELVLVSPLGIKAGGPKDRDYLDRFLSDRKDILAGEYGDRANWPDFAGWDDLRYFEYARSEEAAALYGWEPYLHDPKLARRLRRISARTLIVSGAQDGIILNPLVHVEMQRLMGGNVEHEIFADAAHLIEEVQLDRLADRVAVFLRVSSISK